MNGLQFKTIRKFNGITAKRIGKILNYSAKTIYMKEAKQEEIPDTWAVELGKLIKRDLQDEKELFEVCSKIPERFEKVVKRNNNKGDNLIEFSNNIFGN